MQCISFFFVYYFFCRHVERSRRRMKTQQNLRVSFAVFEVIYWLLNQESTLKSFTVHCGLLLV